MPPVTLLFVPLHCGVQVVGEVFQDMRVDQTDCRSVGTSVHSAANRCLSRQFLAIGRDAQSDQDVVPILKIVDAHSPQVPLVAALPFFIVTACASRISRLSLHFMQ